MLDVIVNDQVLLVIVNDQVLLVIVNDQVLLEVVTALGLGYPSDESICF